jgi:hypothetical protein
VVGLGAARCEQAAVYGACPPDEAVPNQPHRNGSSSRAKPEVANYLRTGTGLKGAPPAGGECLPGERLSGWRGWRLRDFAPLAAGGVGQNLVPSGGFVVISASEIAGSRR